MNKRQIIAIICGLNLSVTSVPVKSAVLDDRSLVSLPTVMPSFSILPKNLPVDIRSAASTTIANDSYSQRLRFPLASSAPISSRFGNRVHPLTGVIRPHAGIDFAAAAGAPVLAALSGRVIYVGDYGGYGTVVAIQHNSGLYTLYAHLSETYAQQGAWVEQSTPIGAVGSTGASTGPHLHFEVRVVQNGAWYAVDPEGYL
jgi:murein DD-endopeptidase MepM/ murein hydrolase activator NlpD